jgi:hypothetical protein
MGQSFVASRRDNCIQFGGISERPENQAHPKPCWWKEWPSRKGRPGDFAMFFTSFEAWACRQTIPRRENFIFGKKNA